MSNALNLTVPQWAYPADFWNASVTVGAVIVPKSGLYVTDQTTLDNLVSFSENPAGVPLTFSATNPAPGPAYTDPSDTYITDLLNDTSTQFNKALSAAYVGRASSLAVAADTPGLPIAVPSGDIQWTATSFNFRPREIGCDGYHYFTYLNTLIIRSTDPTLAARTSGPEFNAASGPKPIRYVTKTSAGWVCIQDDAASDTGQIRFCPNSAGFSTNVADWAVVATTKAFTGISIAKPVLVNGQHWLIAGEYLTGSYPSAARSLWLSTDGGETWASIKSSQVVDSNVNSHWHTALIEPSGRIWASQGDGVNNWLGYTDDQGASWVPVPFGSNPLASGNTYMQPTRMVGFPTEIAAVPDDTNTAGVWALDHDTGVLTVRDNLPSGEQAFGQYGAGSVQRGREAYISFPDQGSGSGKTYIMGTGDYGRTWHLVSTIDGNVFDPIVGIDGNNQIYVQPGASIPTYGSHMMIGALPTWSWQTQ